MRVLCTTQPLFGHLHSMLPYALALQAQGHEVAFATARRFGPVIEGLGFPVFPCGVDFDDASDLLAALPAAQPVRWQEYPPVFAQLWTFILGLGPQMAIDLLATVGVWKPHLVLRDPVEYGGFIAAESWGIPHASVLWAIYINPLVWIPPWLAELCSRFGLAPESTLAHYDRWLVLKALPASWTITPPGEPPATRSFCVPPFDRTQDPRLPPWLVELPDRPTIYATLGTTFNRAPAVFRSVIDALAGLDANGIVTVGRRMDPAQFGTLPANVHVERYIPQSAVLPHCHAVLFHGGFNTLHGALWHGLPLVVVPMGAGDQQPTADHCSKLGLGIAVPGDPPQAVAVRDALRQVLEQPAYGMRARQVAAEMHALPPLGAAVRQLEAVAEQAAG